MAGTISLFQVVRCPKCLKILTEFTDIPVDRCGACSAMLHAKGYNVTTKSVSSKSDIRSINTPLNCSEQSTLSSSNLCSSTSTNNESILHEKELLSKQDESIDKNMNALHKDAENDDQLRPAQHRFDNSKSQDQLRSSLTTLSFSSSLEDNVATVLKSQTNRDPYAYDISISSILNKNHPMSMRTFRHQRPSKLVSNISKEGEEDTVQDEHQFNKCLLKSRTGNMQIKDEGRKLRSLRRNLPTYRKCTSGESLPFSSRVEFEKNQTSHLSEPTFISNASRRQNQDRIELSSNIYDFSNLHIGHHQCSSHLSHCFCSTCSMCSSCAYNTHRSSLIENVDILKMKNKRLQARRQCRPVSNGAPFVICSQCFELLRLPIDFFISKGGSNKLRCGACSEVLVLQFPAKDCKISNKFSHAKSCSQVLQSSHSVGNVSLKPGNSLRERNCEEQSLPPLHLLMGYFSATEVLYQVTDVDEEYGSSEPAMPDSYRRYEEERHKNLLLQYSEEEDYFGSVEVKVENDSSKILNKREKTHSRGLRNVVKRIETWSSKA